MRISEMFSNKTVFSFEIFPPKKDRPIETIYKTLDELTGLSPDFISVTCGAGGSGGSDNTVRLASDIHHKYGRESVAHLPCINLTKEQVVETLDALKAEGVENILALRGDLVPDVEPKKDFRYASELISFVRVHGDFDILGACYPEGHTEAKSLAEDILNLRRKVDAGVSHLVSQLFFDNEKFYAFLERSEIAGIHVPIEAGIMPVTNTRQIARMVSMCGATLPKKFMKIMEKYEDRPEALRDAGIAYAIDQIVDLITQGVDGVHLYTMNNPYVAKRISEAVSSLI